VEGYNLLMIIYDGKSQIDGNPIVAIVTGIDTKSNNSKTGHMPQIWILNKTVHPIEALRTGQDVSVCGNCPHRPQKLGNLALKKDSRSCYVNTMSFNAIFRSYLKGNYDTVDLESASEILKDMHVRLGAYGDPAAVPIEVWDGLLSKCVSTGYTHQWRTCDPRYAEYCMASCDSDTDVEDAVKKGYRVFFVQNHKTIDDALKTVGDTKLAWCPASKEKGKVTTCSKCMACSGTRSKLHSNITILKH